jgi:histidine triad (HIT) family protein
MTDFYCDNVLTGQIAVSIVYETDNVMTYRHTQPSWEKHIVVIPKRHVASLLTLEDSDDELLLDIFKVIRKVAKDLIAETHAARVVTNLGEYQDSKHLHFHVYCGERTNPETG